MVFDCIPVGIFGTNCYIAGDADSRECAIIDPGDEPEKIVSRIEAGRLKPKMIIVTHGHFDHWGAAPALKEEFGIPVLATKGTAQQSAQSATFAWRLTKSVPELKPDEFVRNGDVIRIGKYALEVIEAPGHAPGSICLRSDYEIFVGDNLFKDGIGRTDLPGGDPVALKDSLRKIIQLNHNIKILPGHGPKTTIDAEKENNPFLKF